MSEEAVVADSGQDTSSKVEFDVDQASSELAGNLFPSINKDASDSDNVVDEAVDSPDTESESKANPVDDGATVDVKAKEESSGIPVPKTWPKEMHEYWSKTPKEVQEYWNVREKQMLDGLEQYKSDASYGRSMRDAITPYMALIQAQGIDAPKAVQTLLNAHYKLSVSSPSQKAQYLDYIAKQYGVDIGLLSKQQDQNGQVDPRISSLQDELHKLKQVIQYGSQQQLEAERARIGNEVNAFASDPSHPYFDEVADDIIVMLRAGLSLQDAYDRAVWANPVTRAKEVARLQTEAKAESEKKAREQAEAAKKAASTNIRNRDTRRTPTESSRGTMMDLNSAMKDVMREIKSRTH